MKPIRLRFIEEGFDRTLDDSTKFPKDVVIERFSAQQTIFELRKVIAEQEL